MLEAPDPDAFRAPLESNLDALRKRSSNGPPRHRKGETFIKGPIPWAWIHRAMLLPGKALHVALLLWKESGIKRNRTIRFNLSATLTMGMRSGSARRGLRALATAKLVTVRHHPGQALEVTLLETSVETGDR